MITKKSIFTNSNYEISLEESITEKNCLTFTVRYMENNDLRQILLTKYDVDQLLALVKEGQHLNNKKL